MQRSVIFSSAVLLAAGLIQFACVQDFDKFDPNNGNGGNTASSSSSSSSSGTAGSGGGASSSSASASSTGSSNSSSGGMPCMKKPDCPADDACTTWACPDGMCVPTYQPTGTPVSGATDGDCKAVVCNGAGQTNMVNFDADKPADDGNLCTVEGCKDGASNPQFAMAGTTCDVMKKCNDMGKCAECFIDMDCTMGTTPSCFMDACISCSDGIKNGDEADVDCGGTKCTKKCSGDACTDGMECKSTHCADGVCCDTACTTACKSCNLAASPGTCTNIPINMPDTAPVCDVMSTCDGNGACKLKTGESCSMDGQCLSGKCSNGMPKLCEP